MVASNRSTRAQGSSWVSLIPPVLLVTAGLLLFGGSTGRDDAHITYWPAHTLATTGSIINYNGERVEQSSSLLHVVVLAFAHAVTGVDMVTLGKLSSICFGVLAVFLVGWSTRAWVGSGGALAASLLLALSPSFVYWSYGGMESTLAALTSLWVVIAVATYCHGSGRGALWNAAAAMLAFSLVRPEAPLILGCVLGVALLIACARTSLMYARGRLMTMTGVFAVVVTAIVAFRWFYFGDIFPQPVAAKIGASVGSRVAGGVFYVLGPTTLLTAAAVTYLAIAHFKRAQASFVTTLALLYATASLSSVALSGGDWMEGGRLLVPTLPVAMFLIVVAARDYFEKAWVVRGLLASAITLDIFALAGFAFSQSTGAPAWTTVQHDIGSKISEYSWFERRSRLNVRDMPVVEHLDRLVSTQSSTRPLVIFSGQMGFIPYHLARKHFGRVRFLDRFGLVERTFTDCPATQPFRGGSTAGLAFSYAHYIELRPRLTALCQVATPDIVFDLESTSYGTGLNKIVSLGYTQSYRQVGSGTSSSSWLPGRSIGLGEVVFVRTEVFPMAGVGSLSLYPPSRLL